MSSLMNKFVPVLLLMGGVSLAAPSTTFAKGGHGGGGRSGGSRSAGGSHVVTHTSASAPRGRSANNKGVNRKNSKPNASVPNQVLLAQPDDLGDDILNDINTTINTLTGDPGNGGSFGSTGSGEQSTPEEDGPNSLTNGSGGQYQDGTPPNNPPAGAGTTSGNSNAGSAAGSAMGATAGSTGSSNPPAPISAGKLAKNAKNLVGKVPAGWGTKRNKSPDPGASSKTPANPTNPTTPKTPTNPTSPSATPNSTGSAGGGGSDDNSAPASTTDGTAAAATDVPATTPTAAFEVDLVLEDIQQASPATLVAGPAYKVTFRNQGTEPAGKFQVGIFAGLDSKLAKQAPRAIVEVASLAAGEARTVTLRLPQKAMQMMDAGNKPVAFTHLFVVVDVKNAVAETDKTNNVGVVARADLEAAAK
jgi:hypothetical protein